VKTGLLLLIVTIWIVSFVQWVAMGIIDGV
jgi:hypothetical protein